MNLSEGCRGLSLCAFTKQQMMTAGIVLLPSDCKVANSARLRNAWVTWFSKHENAFDQVMAANFQVCGAPDRRIKFCGHALRHVKTSMTIPRPFYRSNTAFSPFHPVESCAQLIFLGKLRKRLSNKCFETGAFSLRWTRPATSTYVRPYKSK